MATAADYPVTFPFGATDGSYYAPSRAQSRRPELWIGTHHRGDDRAMPMRTPVPVNGVIIGYSGNGKGQYDPHLHTGKFVNGVAVNPNGGGFQLDSPRVLAVEPDARRDPVNAPWVKIIDAHGVVWVYLHLDEVIVKPGQKLEKGTYAMDEEDAKSVVYRGPLFREPENDQVWRAHVGKKPSVAIDEVRRSTEWLTDNHILKVAYPQAVKDLATAETQIRKLQGELQTLAERPTKSQLEIALQTAQACQEQLGAATAKAEAVQKRADELQAQQEQDAAIGSSFLRWLGGFFRKSN